MAEQVPEVKQNTGGRECGMMTTFAIQGGGKTYQNMHAISKYIKDKPDTKVRGRKTLIFDTNGEYTPEEFAKNGIPNFKARTLALKDVRAWCRDPRMIECRRIDAKSLGVDEKKKVLEYLASNVINCQLIIEDINTYVLQLSHMEIVIGKLVALRHAGVDVIMSYQSARAVEPRVFQNSRWIRFHFIGDDIDESKSKVPNYPLYKIAQILVTKRFEAGDIRFFLYITGIGGRKIDGDFTLAEWEDACDKYFLINKKLVKEDCLINNTTEQQSRKKLVDRFTNLYYDNPDKPVKQTEINNTDQQKKI